MIRRQARSTRTDTIFPDTTLVRSVQRRSVDVRRRQADGQCPPRLVEPSGMGDQRRPARQRSEEHTSELQSLMRISYAVFCLKKKIIKCIKVDVYTIDSPLQ